MQRLTSVVVLSVILLSSVSAQALDFTTSAFETWTFSGIQANVGLAFSDLRGSVLNNQGGFFNDPLPLSVPGIGAAQGTQDASHVYTSATLVGSGYVDASADSGLIITAKEVGWLTVTVNYRIQETGTVPLGESLHAFSRVALISSAFGLSDQEVRQVETIVPAGQSLDVTRTITGTFIGKAFFDTIGSTTGLEFAARSQSVPVSDTLWPLLGGLVLLALWWERRKASSSQG